MSEWKMTWSGPQLMLDTAYGPVEVTFTDEDHAHVSAYSDGNRAGDVIFRNKHWYLSVHVYGQYGWDERPLVITHPDGRREYTGEYRHQFKEQDPVNWSNKEIAPTYRAKIMTAVSVAVASFVAEHPDVLAEAQRNSLQHELSRAQEDLAEAVRKQNDAAEKVLRAREALERLEN